MKTLVLYTADDDAPDQATYGVEDGNVTIQVKGQAFAIVRRRKDAPSWPPTVWVLYDAMNEAILGVFSTKERAEAAQEADPQSNVYLGAEEFVVDAVLERP